MYNPVFNIASLELWLLWEGCVSWAAVLMGSNKTLFLSIFKGFVHFVPTPANTLIWTHGLWGCESEFWSLCGAAQKPLETQTLSL